MTNGSFAASESWFARAQKLIPGGVSSPVRAFKHVGGTPVYMKRGQGALIEDEDGRSYVDFCMAWGALILGHAHPAVIEAVNKSMRDGLAFGTCHRHEVLLAELVLEAFKPADRVRFAVSGTEAVLTATRLARAHTGRKLLLKFTGCYHGHVDALLVKAGSGVVTQGLADSEGVSASVAADTMVVPLGDLDALEDVFKRFGGQLAAAIVEPLPANNGLLVQTKEFLSRLRELTQKNGSLLIFDEVISGFRFGFHGYSKVCGVQPDLQTLGKVVGGGLPVAAIVGGKAILDRLAPLGGVYHAGTMAGNPVALAAGLATLTELKTGAPYKRIDELGKLLDETLAKRAGKTKAKIARVGAVFWPYLDDKTPVPTRAEGISEAAVKIFKSRYGGWLNQGLYLPPSAYEVGFLTAAHEPEQVRKLVEAVCDEPAA